MNNTTGHMEFQDSLPMAMPLVSSFLDLSRVVHLAILDGHGHIRFARLREAMDAFVNGI